MDRIIRTAPLADLDAVAAVAAAKRPTLKSPEEVKPPTRLHKEAGHE